MIFLINLHRSIIHYRNNFDKIKRISNIDVDFKIVWIYIFGWNGQGNNPVDIIPIKRYNDFRW